MIVDFQIVKRYLEGNEKDGDKEKILNWFSDLKYDSDLHKQYHRYWNELVNIPNFEGYNGSNILDNIYHKIKLEESSNLKEKRVITRVVNILSRVAAILFIPLITFLIIYKNNLMPAKTEIAYSEIFSPLGTRTKFYLPEGSHGWLNGGSNLKFPTEFKGNSREVLLRGEAYFDVKSDPKKQFVVSGTNFEVIAHGTSFNILAYPDDRLIQVTLVTGNIELSGIFADKVRNFGTMKANQMCIYDLSTFSHKIIPVDANNVISWKEGKLVFKNEPFKEVVRRINRWYNCDIIIKDKILESYTYLATFEDETLDEVLKLLKLSAPIDYKNIGRVRKEDGTFEKRKIELYYKQK